MIITSRGVLALSIAERYERLNFHIDGVTPQNYWEFYWLGE